MIISVINHTNGQISDEQAQQAIQAINRQIAIVWREPGRLHRLFRPPDRTSLDPAVLASSSHSTGCCCLNILTTAPPAGPWTIHVSGSLGAQNRAGRDMILNPTDAPVEFGAFTASGRPAFQGAVPTAGH